MHDDHLVAAATGVCRRPAPAHSRRPASRGWAALAGILTGLLSDFAGVPIARAEPVHFAPRLGLSDGTPRQFALTDIVLHQAPGRTIEAAVLVVVDGRVVAAGPAATTPVPPGVVAEALPGRHVYPAFVDLYSDWGLAAPEAAADGDRPRRGDRGPQSTGSLPGARSWNDAVRADVDWVAELSDQREAADRLLAQGVAVVATARQDGVLRGRNTVVSLAPGPFGERVLRAAAQQVVSFGRGSSRQDYPASEMGAIALVRQSFLDARWWRLARAAYERNPAQTMPPVDTAVAALASHLEADGGVLFATNDESQLLRAGALARELGLRAVLVGSNRELARLEEVAALGMPIVLPASLPKRPAVAAAGSERGVSLAALRIWDHAPGAAAALAGRGVRIAFTASGLTAGEDLLGRVRERVARGLAPDAALAALTTVPAELAGVAHEVGTLEPGRRANLIVADRALFVPPGKPGGGESTGSPRAAGAGDAAAAAAGGPPARARGGKAEEPRVLGVWVDGRPAWQAPRDWRGRYRVSQVMAAGEASTELVVRASGRDGLGWTVEVAEDGGAEAPGRSAVATAGAPGGDATTSADLANAPAGDRADRSADPSGPARPRKVELRDVTAGEHELAGRLEGELATTFSARQLVLVDLARGSARARELAPRLLARLVDAAGVAREVVVERLAEPAATPEATAGSSAAAPLEPTAARSRVTFPNVAFGFAAPPGREDVLVRGATVWTSGPQGVLARADLLVRGGKIVAIGSDLAVPAGVTVIAGEGLHVTPGMIDEHSHLAISGGVNEGTHPITAEVRIGDVLDPNDVGIYRALAGGTTAAQLLHGSSNPIGGQAQVIKLRWGGSAEELKLAGAPPTIKMALGENVKQSNWGDRWTERYPQTRMGVETLMRDRFRAARAYREAAQRFAALSATERAARVPPRRDLQLEALAEIVFGERFVHVHSYVQSEILATLRLAEELGFRLQTFTHALETYKVASELARHGAGASLFSDWWAYKLEVADAIPQAPCIVAERGVVTSLNSDSEETIRRLNQEAGKMVSYCGLDEAAALAMVTINPARQLRIDDRVGSLEVGKDADFVLWNGHPLSIYSRPEATFVDGVRRFDRQRDLELRARDREEKAALVAAALDEDGDGGEPAPGTAVVAPGPHHWHCEDLVARTASTEVAHEN